MKFSKSRFKKGFLFLLAGCLLGMGLRHILAKGVVPDFCRSAMGCGDRVVSHETSPDGQTVATVFERDCGATTDVVTIVTLGDSIYTSTSLNPLKDTNVIYVSSGERSISCKWQTSNVLILDGVFKPDLTRTLWNNRIKILTKN